MIKHILRQPINVLIGQSLTQRHAFHTSPVLQWITKQTRLRVVDNSQLGREAMTDGSKVKCIHVYTKKKTGTNQPVGQLGDKVLVTIKGQMKRGYLVGLRAYQRPMVPKFDTNNVVLIEDNGNPLGTRVAVPVPNYLRSKGPELAKIIAISSRFV
ncbi:39S ribosomal protein L14, mitochondrial-like [Oppia nitens]|uniref:39S ribosomal protein L14, mitochondrial-like n=1 Tax=Oppia nitens TaxID=1686743 RepID=UPI0023DC8B66|nr:39S ribosomal protein L14, mitochondrial-like [Oppia nitens]